jgi:uncharacterized protein DUF1573
MKSFVLAIAALLVTTGIFAQAQTPAATVKKADSYVKFKDVIHDFGKIKQNSPVTYNFVFTNVTDKPVVIESATASCGCTTPVKPEAPVAKGKDDKITAGFNAAAAGPFNKTIYVKVAGVEQPMELKITGEVLNAEEYAKFEQTKSNKKG